MTAPSLPEKVCAVCGRRFAWRKKWARDWEAVRHCSERCRRTRRRDHLTEDDAALRAALARLACGERVPFRSLLPSALQGDGDALQRWLAAARRLEQEGALRLHRPPPGRRGRCAERESLISRA